MILRLFQGLGSLGPIGLPGVLGLRVSVFILGGCDNGCNTNQELYMHRPEKSQAYTQAGSFPMQKASVLNREP